MGTYNKHPLGEGFKRPQKGSGPRKAHPGDNGPRATRGAPGSPTLGRGDPGQLHVMDGPLPVVFNNPEEGSRTLLRELLASAGRLPPVQKCLVRQVLPRVAK
jgi:hypothetical protein